MEIDGHKGLFSKKISYMEFLLLLVLMMYSSLTIINASLLPRTFLFLGYIRYILLAFQAIFLANIVFEIFVGNFKKSATIILAFFLMGISFVFSGMNAVLITAIVVISLKKCDFDNIVLFLIIGQVLGIVMVVLSMYMGIIENISTIRLEVTRYSLGFLNPNTISNYLLSISLKVMYLLRNRRSLFILVCLNMLFMFVMTETNSRTSFFLLLAFDLLYLLFIVITKTGKEDKFLRLLILVNKLSFYSLLGLSFISATYFSYTDPILVTINNLFSNRISSAYKFYEQYGYSLFGQQVELVSTYEAYNSNIGALILDNGYLQLLIIYGVATTIIFVIFWNETIKKISLNRQYILAFIFLIYAIYGFNSGLFLSWEYNFVLFYGVKKFNKVGVFNGKNRDFNLSSLK